MSPARKQRRANKRSSYHHHNLAPALLKVAEQTLEKDGLSALSLREVARRAGVSHNAPYRHFQDREALLAALAAQGFADLRRQMEAAAGAAPDSRERRRGFGRAYVLFALNRPGMFRLMFSGLMTASQHPGLVRNSQNAFQILAGTFVPEGGVSAGPLRAWALVHGVAHLLLDQQIAVPPGLTPEAFIDEILSGPGIA